MHTVEFIPADWLERPILVERRVSTRRAADVTLLLQSLLSAQA